MLPRKSILIFLSLFLILTACAKDPEIVGELPQAEEGFTNSASEQSGFDEEETRRAAERFFGSGAESIARLIEDIFNKHGRPTAYIVRNYERCSSRIVKNAPLKR